MPAFKLPNDTQRATVIGKTGSGKTQGAVWQLSERSITTIPWVILDFKRDVLIAQIPFTNPISLGVVPRNPGIYIVRPNPGQEDQVESYLWTLWETENIGIFIDEGYMLGRSPALQAIYTQGRSKHLPTITLTQRPSYITRFAFSEADFIQVYRLTDARDRKVVKEFVPYDFEAQRPLPPYWSVWYDDRADRVSILRPVPDMARIIDTFRDRLGPKSEPEPDATETPNLGPAPSQKRFILI